MTHTGCAQLVRKLINSNIEFTKTKSQTCATVNIGFPIGADVGTAGQERTDIHIQGLSPVFGSGNRCGYSKINWLFLIYRQLLSNNGLLNMAC
jgi:hypothetical protein